MTINKLTDEQLAEMVQMFAYAGAHQHRDVIAALIELQECRKAGESTFPGVMRCPICDFSRTHINVTPTGNYAGKSVHEECPNGCGALCPDTYKRQYESLYDYFQQMEKEYAHDLAELQEYRKAEKEKSQ